jgi:hypothetical protein
LVAKVVKTFGDNTEGPKLLTSFATGPNQMHSSEYQEMNQSANQQTHRILVACLLLICLASPANAQRRQHFITQPKLDPKAPKVGLFDGVLAKQFGIAIIPTNEKIGSVLIENKTDNVLTVQLPDSIVGRQVPNRVNPNAQQAQPIGGGFLGGPLRNGMFSIPPKRIAQVQYRSVCLAHGLPEPRPNMPYQIMSVNKFTKNKTLQTLIHLIGTERIDQKVAQAAAWHVASRMTWVKLARETTPVGGFPVPYFNRAQLTAAHQLVAIAEKRAKQPAKPTPSSGEKKSEPRSPAALR